MEEIIVLDFKTKKVSGKKPDWINHGQNLLLANI